MPFQAYIDNIKTKKGKSPDDFKKHTGEKGFLKKGELSTTLKTTEITNRLKEDFELGYVLRISPCV